MLKILRTGHARTHTDICRVVPRNIQYLYTFVDVQIVTEARPYNKERHTLHLVTLRDVLPDDRFNASLKLQV
jgi:hypothetical protein